MEFPKHIQQKLEDRKKEGTYRELVDFSDKIDFFSNDYLGMANKTFEINQKKASTGSRLISGNSKKTEKIEDDLALFFGFKFGLLFNSGYDANLGIFSSIPQKGDTILYDEYAHASIRDGIRLSHANSYKFKHNDLNDLETKLKTAKGNVFIAVESIYSMDGDEAPLVELVKLSNQYKAYLIVDEAHACGYFGEKGKGLVDFYGLNTAVWLKLVTFGKAYGSHGAIVLTNQEMTKEYLINFARSLIYTTSLPPATIEHIQKVVFEVEKMDQERETLKHLIQYFKEKTKNGIFNLIESNSPIQSLLVTGNQNTLFMADKLQKANFAVKAILSPTVPKNKERIRICLHSFNSEKEIDDLLKHC